MSLNAEDLEKLAAMVQAKHCPGGKQMFQMETDLTICIPVKDAITTLGYTLDSITLGSQSIQTKVILAENGGTDGSQLFVRGIAADGVTRAHWGRFFPEINAVLIPQDDKYPVANRARHRYNIRECYRRFAEIVDTPYVMLMDADVDCPAGGLRTARDVLALNPEIGITGFVYDPQKDHLQGGAMMMRKDDFLKWTGGLHMNPPYPCMCSQYNDLCLKDGKKVHALNPLTARHRRLEV